MRASIAGMQVAVPGYYGRVVEAVVKAAWDRVDELHPLRGPRADAARSPEGSNPSIAEMIPC